MTRRDKLYLALLLAGPLIAFYPMYFSSKIMCWLDMMFYFMPFRVLPAEIVKQGIAPLWNPFIYCGNPLMANMQSAVYNPLSVFYYVLPAPIALKVITFIAFYIGSAFTYVFSRAYKASEEGSLIAATVYAYTFYMFAKAVELADLHVMMWMPAALYFIKLYFTRRRVYDLAFAVITLCMSLLGGHPQVFSYIFLLFCLIFFYEAVTAKMEPAQYLKIFFIIIAGLALVTVAQTGPTLKFILNSKRVTAGTGFSANQQGFMHFEQLLLMVAPFAQKYLPNSTNFINWMGLIQVGTIHLLLFALAFSMNDRRLRNFLLFTFLGVFFIAVIGNLPFYEWLFNNVKLLQTIRYPAKINIIMFFIICMMSAFGFDVLFNRKTEELKPYRIMAIVLGVVAVASYLVFDFFRESITRGYLQTLGQAYTGEQKVLFFESYINFLKDFLIFVFIFCASCYAVYYTSKKGPWNEAYKIAFAFFAVIMAFCYRPDGWTGPYAEYSWLTKETKNVKHLLGDPDMKQKRVLAPWVNRNMDRDIIHYETVEDLFYYKVDTLEPNMPMAFGLMNSDGFDSLMLGSFYDFKLDVAQMNRPWESGVFKLLSSKYLASAATLSDPSLTLRQGGDNKLYEFRDSLDIAYFVPGTAEIKAVPNKKKAIYEMYNTPFDPRAKLMLDADPGAFAAEKSAEPARAEFSMTNTNTYTVKIDAPSAGFLVLTDNYYPGWEAYVDGVKTRIFRAYTTFKAVRLEKGGHTVVFKYAPVDDYVYLAVSLIFIALLSAMPLALKGKKQ